MRTQYDPEDFDELLSDVGGSDEDAHYHALQVFIDHQEATRPRLIERLRHAPSEFTRSRCVTALTGMDHAEVEQALLHALQHDPSAIVRDAAVVRLRELDNTAALPILIKTLSDRSDIVRRWSASILGKLGSASAVPRLRQALDDRDEWTAFHAADSLRQWNVPEARTALERLRDYASENAVRTCAKQSLWEWDQGKVI